MPLVEVPNHGTVEFPEDMPPEEIGRHILESFPDLQSKAPSSEPFDFSPESDYTPPNVQSLKEFFAANPNFSKPQSGPNASTTEKIVTGAERAGVNVLNSILTPTTAALVGVGAIPVVGKPLAIAAGAGMGAHAAITGSQQFYEAVKRGDVQGAAESAGNAVAGLLFAGIGMKAAAPEIPTAIDGTIPVETKVLAPASTEAFTKGEPNAIPEQSANAQMLREPQPQVGLPEVGTRNAQPQEPAPAQEATAPVSQPQEQITEGPGAMTAGELAPVKEMTTSDKLRLMDQRREELGLPKQDPVLKYTNAQALEDAKYQLDQDPGWLDNLISELRDKPRAVFPQEEAGLNIRRAELSIELERALKNWKEAFENDQYERAADEGQNVDRWRKAVDDLDAITGRGGTGTEAGRSLQARKMALDEEFRLVRMDMESRQAKGEDLTPAEQQKVIDLNQKIEKTGKAFEEHLVEAEKTGSETAAEEALKNETKKPRAKIKPTPEQLDAEKADLLKGLKEASQEEGAKPDDINSYIKELAKHFVEQGMKELDPIIGAIKKELDAINIEMTPREIKDAFSDYGKSTPAPTEPVKVTLSQLRGEAQKVSALQDIIEKQQAPLATGQRRVPPSDATRRLIKEINEAKKKYNIQTTDPARQLKSALDSIRTRLNNAIKDIQFEISTGKKIIRQKGVTPSDADIAAKRAQLAELRAIKAEMFPKEPLTREQLEARALKGAERSEAYWNERLAEAKKGNLATPEKPAKVTNAQIEAIEARRDAAREEVKLLKDIAEAPAKEAKALENQKIALEKQIAELEAKIKSGDLESPGSRVNRPAHPVLEVLKQRREALNKELAEARDKPLAAERLAKRIERIDKRVADINERIAKGDLAREEAQARVNRPLQPALEQAQQRLEAANKRLANARENSQEQQRLAKAVETLNKRVADIQAKIDAGDLSKQKAQARINRPLPPELEQARQKLDAINAQLAELRKKPPEQIALQALKTRLANRTADLKDRLARGDFEPKPNKVVDISQDPEAMRLKAEHEHFKERYQASLNQYRLAKRSRAQKIWDAIKESVNLPKTILSSMDVSAVLRQGGMFSLGHPIKATRAMGAMFKSLISESKARIEQQKILSRPNAPLYKSSKLYIAPLEEGVKLTSQEEMIMSRLAEKIPGVRASNRAFIIFLNRIRADAFDTMAASIAKRSGADMPPEALKAISNFINVSTGRGDLGKATASAETLSTVFFSPRLVASRFQLLAGQPLYRGTLHTRALIAREYAQTLIGLSVVYALGKMAGATIETDPRSSDFGKLKFGNTRVDPLMGLAQNTVLLGRLISGQTKGLRGIGHIVPIRGDHVPYGGTTTPDVISRFLRAKLSPVVGSGVDVLSGKNVVGEKVSPGTVAKNLLTPLSFQDIYSIMEENGMERGAILEMLSMLGMGVQNFNANIKQR